MSRFIEHGKRYGLDPWQLPIEYNGSTGETYVTGSPSEPEAGMRFDKMLKALGMGGTQRTIPYEEGAEIFEAIDRAIKNAPQKWAR